MPTETNRLTPLQQELFALQDLNYKNFHAGLIPTVPKERIIGVRTPQLRRFAAAFYRRPECNSFLANLPHDYYEENNLHAFCIEKMQDFESCVAALNLFLPYVNNWATCDSMRPKVLAKNKSGLLKEIRRWLSSGQVYTVRYGIVSLMTWFLDDDFSENQLEWVATVSGEDYYIQMAVAWYFATALAKQWETALPYLQQNRLSPWQHQKTIQKAVESRRLTTEQKAYLKTLKHKT